MKIEVKSNSLVIDIERFDLNTKELELQFIKNVLGINGAGDSAIVRPITDSFGHIYSLRIEKKETTNDNA